MLASSTKPLIESGLSPDFSRFSYDRNKDLNDMSTYRTGNPIGSADPRDLYDNAQVIDQFANSDELTAEDRLGTSRRTIAGMNAAVDQAIANAGYVILEDEYAPGIEITARNQVIRADGELWRISASEDLPYTTTGGGMPEGGAFVSVGDAVLRQELVQPVATFNNVQDMKDAAGLDVGRKARTLGYYEPGDGGGNDYEIVAAGTAPADGGSYIDLGGSGLQAKGLFPADIYVEMFGASESLTPLVEFKAAAAYAEQVGRPLKFRGSYDFSADWDTDFPSTLTLEGVGDKAEIKNAYIKWSGSFDEAIAITSAVGAGDRSISLADASTLTPGGWVKLVSPINSQSNDAWPWSMGSRTNDFSYISEFRQIESISGNDVVLSKGTLFPYPTSGSTDSGARSESVVYPVNFIGPYTFKNVRMVGINGARSSLFEPWIALDVKLENCQIDSSAQDRGCIRPVYCGRVSLKGGEYKSKIYSSQGNLANTIKFVSCFESFVRDGARIVGGFQAVDVTYIVSDTYGGGPSISCGAIGTIAMGAGDDHYTDHPGVWGSMYIDNTAHGCIDEGIRIRGREATVRGNSLSGRSNNGATGEKRGIIITDLFTAGTKIQGNTIVNFNTGIIQAGSSAAGDFNTIDFDNTQDIDISDNRIIDCWRPIFTGAPANNKISNRSIKRNIIIRPGTDAITINPYANGADVEDNKIYEVGAESGVFHAAISLAGNVKRVHIGKNYSYLAKERSNYIRGPITTVGAAFMTDTTTFPAGDDEAFLVIEEGYSDSEVPIARMRVSPNVFDKPDVVGLARFMSSISNNQVQSSDLYNGSVHFFLNETDNTFRAQILTSTGDFKNVVLGTWT